MQGINLSEGEIALCEKCKDAFLQVLSKWGVAGLHEQICINIVTVYNNSTLSYFAYPEYKLTGTYKDFFGSDLVDSKEKALEYCLDQMQFEINKVVI